MRFFGDVVYIILYYLSLCLYYYVIRGYALTFSMVIQLHTQVIKQETIYIARARIPNYDLERVILQAQLLEHSACNREIVGLSPTRGVLFSTSQYSIGPEQLFTV